MSDLERRVDALERRRAPDSWPALPDGLKMAELSYVAIDVLEAVTRAWPAELCPPGLCAAVAAACDRPPAERVMAVGMALARHWPEGDGDPMRVMTELTRSGLLPGFA